MPTTIPTKDNYTFLGWYTSLDAIEPYNFDRPVTSEFTLYAKWLGNNVTVTLKPNNGENPYVITGRYGEAISKPSYIPVKEGYNFLGWYVNLNDEEPYDFSNPLTGNLVLEAKWELAKYKVTIIFYNEQDNIILESNYGDIINAPGVLEKVGYNFVGYKVNGKPATFPITVTSDVVIEVVWEPIRIQVIFDDGYSQLYYVDVNYGSLLTPISLPAREGYTFKGWYKDFALTEPYTFDEFITSTIVLYAKWEIKQYKIFFNTNGGTRIPYLQVEYNTPLYYLALDDSALVTEKEGYEFVGWYKNIELTEEFDFTKELMPARDIYLYAKWKLKTYKFIFDDLCGNLYTYEYAYGQKINKIPDPVREGYHFSGWYTNKEYTNMYIFGSAMPAHDVIVYAKWLKEYQVTYYVDGVIIGRDTAVENSYIRRPLDPVKSGYVFVGWYTEPTFENIYNFNTVVTNHINLYARFELKQTVIRFESNGGTKLDPIIGYYGEVLTLPIPEKEGCTFIGWVDVYGNSFTSNIIPHDDITLYARWEGNIYTIVFDSQGGYDVATMYVRYGSPLTLPATARIGYNFVGWAYEGKIFTATTMPAHDLYLVAIWNREYTPGLIFEYVKTTNTYEVVGYTGSSTSVYIPSYYNGLLVTGIRANAFANNSYVTTITLGQNIETIGSKAFYSMPVLTTVLIEDGSKLKTIGTYAFQNSARLESINLQEGLTTISDYAFYGTGLTSIVIPASVKTIGPYAFAYATKLKEAIFAYGTTISSLPNYVFTDSGLTKIVIPSSVTSIGNYAFRNCLNLKEIVIPNSVTTVGTGILKGALNVEEITLPGIFTLSTIFYSSADTYMSRKIVRVNVAEGSTKVVNSFISGLGFIKEVVLPNGVVTIEASAFYNATGLTTINIPDSVDTIGDNAFYNTTSLSYIILSKNLRTIGNNAFENSGLVSIVIPASVTSIGSYAFRGTAKLISASFANGSLIQSLPDYMFYNSRIESFVVPSSVTSIGNYAFANCKYLKTLVIPNSVKTIGNYILRYATSLEELTIPGIFTVEPLFNSNTTSYMSQVLRKVIVADGSTQVVADFIKNLTQVKEVVIPNSVTSIGSNAFYGATNLTTINIPNTLTTIGNYAFYNTKSLNVLSISKDSNLQSIGSYAFSLSGIKSIYIPKGVITVGTYAFSEAINLSEVIFDKDINLAYLSDYMFYKVKTLGHIDIPKSVVEIKPYAFNSTGLEKITIPNSVTKIGNYALANNLSLKEVHIPSSVVTIGTGILRGSLNVEELTVPGIFTIATVFYDNNDSYMSRKLVKVNVASGTTTVTSSFLYNINHVKEVVLPDGLREIGTSAFYYATGLSSINFPVSVETIGANAFAYTSSLSTVELSPNIKTIGANAFESSGLISIVIPASVTSIGTAAFKNTTKLVSATFANNALIQSLPVEMFYGSRIESFTVPKTVTSIGNYAFGNTNSLKSLEIPASVKTFGNAILKNASSITELTLPGNQAVMYLFGILDSSSDKAKLVATVAKTLNKVNVADGSTTIVSEFILNLTQVREVVIPYGVTTIGNYAFSGATNLTSINIPNSITSIGAYAFYNTKLLTVLSISKDSELQSIGNYAFSGSGIRSIFIPKKVTSVGSYAFSDTLNLSEVIFDKDIILSYLSDYMFYKTPALKAIDIPNSIIEIKNYCFDNSGLEKLTLPNGVTKIGNYAFVNCLSLKEIVIPNSVTTVGTGILKGALNVEEITLPGIFTLSTIFYSSADTYMSRKIVRVNVAEGSTKVVNSFISGLGFIKEVVLPNGVVTIEASAFYNATGLTTINIPDSVDTIGDNAFYNTTSLSYIILSKNLRTIGNNAFENSGLVSIVIPASVTSIGSYAFRGTAKLISASFANGSLIQSLPDYMFYNSRIESFVVPSSVTSIGNYAFANCKYLKTLVIPNSVKTIGNYILRYATSLEELTIPGIFTVEPLFNSNTTSYMSQVLRKVIVADGSTQVVADFIKNLTQVKEVVIPNSVTSIGSNAFYGATNLTTINIPNTLTTIGNYAFYNTKSLNVLSISKDSNLQSIGSYAFSLSGIKSIYIPKGVITVGTYAFSEAINLSEVIFDKDINLAYLSDYMFYKVKTLGHIDIPKSVVEIKPYAFNSTGLEKITIPNSVTKIGNYALANNLSLKEVHIPSSVVTIGTGILRGSLNVEELTVPGIFTIATVFYDNNDSYMSRKLVKVNVASGTTTVTSSFLYNINHVKEVVLPDGLREIGTSAFYYATGLSSINFPVSVETIGANAFAYTSSLSTVELSPNIKTIGANAFESSGLISIVIPASVTSIGTAAFKNTTKLVSATFANNALIQSLPVEMFYGSAITSFVIPNSVTSIGNYAFRNAKSLKKIVILNNVKTFGKTILNGASSIQEITLPGSYYLPNLFDTVDNYSSSSTSEAKAKVLANVPATLTKVIVADGSTTIVSEFVKDLTQIQEVILPEGIVTINNYAFYGLTKLTTFTLPNSVKTIGQYAFANTTNLEEFIISEDSLLQSIGAYCFNNSGIKSIYIPKDVITLGTYIFSNATRLHQVVFAKDIKITTISDYMFQNTKALKYINLPETVTQIGNYVFDGSALVKIIIPANVTKIGNYAFRNNSSLTEIYIPSSVTTFGTGILRGSVNVLEITMPGHVTLATLFYNNSDEYMSKKITKVYVADGTLTIASSFLSGYSIVKEVYIPYGVKEIGANAFNKASNLSIINIPDSIDTIGDSAFAYTTSLSTIILSNNLRTIGNNAFENSGLVNIVIPSSVTTIGSYAFRNTSRLVSATFATGTNIQSLPTGIFQSSNIESFEVPNSVKTIYDNAFNNCKNLKNIVIPSSVTTIGSGILRYSTEIEEITVPGSFVVVNLFYSNTDTNMSRKLVKVNIANGSTNVATNFLCGVTTVREVFLPYGIREIGNTAFKDCTNLETINIPRSVEVISSTAFTNTPKLVINWEN